MALRRREDPNDRPPRLPRAKQTYAGASCPPLPAAPSPASTAPTHPPRRTRGPGDEVTSLCSRGVAESIDCPTLSGSRASGRIKPRRLPATAGQRRNRGSMRLFRRFQWLLLAGWLRSSPWPGRCSARMLRGESLRTGQRGSRRTLRRVERVSLDTILTVFIGVPPSVAACVEANAANVRNPHEFRLRR
jgi:hypothetical protein